MAWFDGVQALTPVAAWDAKHFTATQLVDRVASNNLTFNGEESDPLHYYSFKGNSARLPWNFDSAIQLPTECVLAGFIKSNSTFIMFYEQQGQGSRFLESESSYMAQYSNSFGGSVTSEAPAANQFTFVVLVKGSFGARMYWDMQWRGSVFPANYVGAEIRGVGWNQNGSGYNIDQYDAFSAAGVWNGTASLQDLQALETALRSELAGPPVNNYSASLSRGAVIANDLAYTLSKPASYSADLQQSWKNVWNNGVASIEGITTIENIPGARQVRLYDKATGQLVNQTFSNAVGQYIFNNVDATREYFVVAHDHLRVYNGVISDMLTP